MNKALVLRVEKTAHIILDQKLTVREVAKIVGCSKSTVHKDLTERLPLIDCELYDHVMDLLSYNKSIRHIRGGLSTKLKYIALKEQHHEKYLFDTL